MNPQSKKLYKVIRNPAVTILFVFGMVLIYLSGWAIDHEMYGHGVVFAVFAIVAFQWLSTVTFAIILRDD